MVEDEFLAKTRVFIGHIVHEYAVKKDILVLRK